MNVQIRVKLCKTKISHRYMKNKNSRIIDMYTILDIKEYKEKVKISLCKEEGFYNAKHLN